MKTFELGCTGLVAIFVLACSAESGSDEKAEVGVLQMELSSTVGDRVYELLDANFLVQGNGSDLLLSGDDVELIEQDLAPGDYTVTLEDSWRIERTANGVTEAVPAVLTSENPVTFTIEEGAITPVVYVFEAGDGVITFGNGRLQLGVQIIENNGNGASCASSNECDAGFECVEGECLGLTGTPCDSNQECADGVCSSFYSDLDGDGFGAGVSSAFCGTAAPGAGFVSNNLDCCDSDADANPNYSEGFSSTPTACGDFDFDCDGAETSQFTPGTCASFTTQATCPAFVYAPPPGPICGELGAGSVCAWADASCQSVRGAALVRACY